MSMTIKDFCRLHGACAEGAKWALSCGASTMAELWARDDVKPEWRIWIATRTGALTDLEARLFACWCVRQVWHLLADERSRNAVETAERFARGEASTEELDAARDAAWDAWDVARAVRDAARDAWSSRSAARHAASAATAAAWAARAASAARDAARDAWDAAWAATSAAEWASEWDASAADRAAQALWLIENTRPIFGKSEERDGEG